MRVLVVGAGVGGLTAALALRQSGFDAHLYEQARVLREVGAGLRRWAPHAIGDLAIGADGVHSVVREYVAGPDQPTWWPQIAWRAWCRRRSGAKSGSRCASTCSWGRM
jgi:2-polyprenyl-6-methoxyphenol hydroxylase-like FAD-dependent oxidoreductase